MASSLGALLVARLFEREPSPALWNATLPIRGELFSIERLEDHGRTLAASHAATTLAVRGQPLAARLSDNSAYLLKANQAITRTTHVNDQISPAAEWLIDNYHLVDMQIREIGVDLPAGYYSQLPKLSAGPFAGLPRVFAVAWSLVAHTDSRFEPTVLHRYLCAYQTVQPLTIGELWAVPITLRIVLIENLRRMAEVIDVNSVARHAANQVADRVTGRGMTPTEQAGLLEDAVTGAVSDAFAAQLSHRLRGQDPTTDPVLTWLDEQLAAQGTTTAESVHDEQLQQGMFNATIRNVINSLRLTAGIDWTEAFESVCPVTAVLAADANFFEMTFPTRNLYWTAIEQMARGSALTEVAIAQRALNAAAGALNGPVSETGYHLLAGGRDALEAAIGFRPPLRSRLRRAGRAIGIRAYGSAIIGLSVAFVGVPCWASASAGLEGWRLVALGLLGFVPATEAAVACVNRAAMWLVGATSLPGMQLRNGIPASLRTIVAVPALLTTARAIDEQVAQIELHYLASQDGELHFTLLSDWTDSETEHADGDAGLLALATDAIATLNRRHGPAPGGTRFILLHRRRTWNAGEGRWIGWERKRGKLHELNRLLRGAADTGFYPQPDDAALPTGIRYVVTLDADTRLPHETVRRLVGKMAHPLNAPILDPVSGRVISGYAVLQPRVTPSLPVGRNSTLFQRIFSNMDGIDPYAAAVSDVYQDLFGEGSYAGKGIYDLDAFEAALAGRVPDSTLLSHDLFEGVFARAGLASDVEVVEEFPTGYVIAARRQHRWARGDWQLLPWIATFAGRSALPTIGRWKMLDNLRRTLAAPAAVLALLVAWRLPFQGALIWTGFVMASVILPALLPVLGCLFPRRQWITLRSYLSVLGAALRHAMALTGLSLVFLAHQASLMADAVVRTLIRVFVTRRHLLEWTTAAQVADGPQASLPRGYAFMVGGVSIGVVAAALALWSAPLVWVLALPFAVLWIASPAIATWASAFSVPSRRACASNSDIEMLRLTARRTWRFFENFVTPADHMLPPDNFQEDPAPVVARRTSPTNIGLYLLTIVSAHDFGWAGLVDTVERLEGVLKTIARLARFRGHFYN